MADNLMNSIATGEIEGLFLAEYFPEDLSVILKIGRVIL